MRKQKRTIGSIVKIDLGNDEHSYARVLDKACYAFYDIKAREEIKNLNEIISKPILFIVSAYDDIITRGRWVKIGVVPLEDKLKQLPMQFIKDAINPDEFSIYNPNTGEIFPAKKEECISLECAAVWEAEHVEERLKDHFQGKQNRWLDDMKIK
ncbi:MAG: immunity 26/phosphotriesterase HocA family protein [Calditrichaceae bacterium]|nr:immunity 26/phosphotriesterase HocA family protein [Calditrichaceae bacterium]MBN2707680.1 immunity 26/phosphotriesterase HocA family protein [Calditrichaceae bacterium]RQV97788.1 MAG: hypothetical protein EH224_00200 [Calditrichota bacterium]